VRQNRTLYRALSVRGRLLLKIQILNEKPQGSGDNRPRGLQSAGTKQNQGYAPSGTKWNLAAPSPDACIFESEIGGFDSRSEVPCLQDCIARRGASNGLPKQQRIAKEAA